MNLRADPARTMGALVTALVANCAPFVGAHLVRVVVDAAGRGDAAAVRAGAVALGGVVAAAFLVNRARSRLVMVLIEKATERYDRSIIRLAADTPGIEHLEHPEYVGKLEQLRFQPQALGQNGSLVTVLVWGVVQVGLLLWLLASVHPLLVALPAVAVVNLVAVRRASNISWSAFEAASDDRRRAAHLFDVATSTARAAEVRTLGIEDDLVARHRAAWGGAGRTAERGELAAGAYSAAGSLLMVLAYAGSIALVVDRGVRGRATPGEIVLTVVLAGLVNAQLNALLDIVNRLMLAFRTVDRYLWLVDHAEARRRPGGGADPPARLADGIRLEGVTFRYRGADQPALIDVTLRLPAGSVVAVAGDNGAGKTTLVKLLTGMYQPTEGRITVDGVPLEELDVAAWRTRCSAAFQDHARLELLLQEAVGVGDLPRLDDAGRVGRALSAAGGDGVPARLRDGLATPLGSSFDGGVDLSGGEWQKVALARALMREAPLLLVFDEPSASLDPAAERELFERHAAQARRAAAATGTITVLVTHRFSTVRTADLIVVVDGGAVVEQGTHEELMAAGGTYAELYSLQAAGYR